MSERRRELSERSLVTSTGLIVVKLGGSVVRSSELQSWLDAIAQGARVNVAHAEGGSTADIRNRFETDNIPRGTVAFLLPACKLAYH